jgi:isopenicillin N synthase-like dioxygenase
MAIPSVDLADFLSGDEKRKQSFVQSLGKAYEEVGFVGVKNHGLTEELIENLYKYVQQFFSLPLSHKKNYEIPGMAGQRGYTSFGKEHAKGSDAPDLKEFFQYGQEPRDNFKEEYYEPNVQVAEVIHFNETFMQAYRAFEKSGTNYITKGFHPGTAVDIGYYKVVRMFFFKCFKNSRGCRIA